MFPQYCNLYFSKEALEAMLRKKRECNAKALEIVERLLGNTVSEEWFLDCVSLLLSCVALRIFS